MRKKAVLDWVKAIVIAVVIVFVIQNFFFANYVVHGQSMLPTIHDGNRVIVNKIDYDLSKPERFELIVFHYSESEDFIKRVIGLPGDSLHYENDVLYINGEPMKEPYLKPFKEQLVSGKLTQDFTLKEKTGKKVVPKGKVFVLGDNRRRSYDSRYFGFVSMDDIVGKVDLRYWPISAFEVY
ncbi:MAG TPA: signal peptidase I [Bacillales bacterium]|nr:signal peptidase I [Bacillales bacterium]